MVMNNNPTGLKRIFDKISSKKYFWLLIFLLPALVLYIVFYIFPFFYALFLSFMQWNLISPVKNYVGIENYSKLFSDRVFLISLKNTVVYVFSIVPLSMFMGIALAVIVERMGQFRNIFRLLLFIPVVTSLAVSSLVWVYLLHPMDGVVNNLLAIMGIEGKNWLYSREWAMIFLIIVGIWNQMGYNMVLYISGLKNIDKELYSAAKIDGAGEVRQFLSITLPIIAPMSLFVLVVTVIQSFKVFTTISVMTQGGPNNATNMLVYQVYQEAFQFFDIGRASALAMIIFLIVGTVAIVQIKIMESRIHYQ